mmetsp:Transcript_28103/g.96766  ORF Transcript_28103/g.96766 Transcript_28103/m.96766 type:complete len:228 (+) Transcript_28103:284-967(+)
MPLLGGGEEELDGLPLVFFDGVANEVKYAELVHRIGVLVFHRGLLVPPKREFVVCFYAEAKLVALAQSAHGIRVAALGRLVVELQARFGRVLVADARSGERKQDVVASRDAFLVDARLERRFQQGNLRSLGLDVWPRPLRDALQALGVARPSALHARVAKVADVARRRVDDRRRLLVLQLFAEAKRRARARDGRRQPSKGPQERHRRPDRVAASTSDAQSLGRRRFR